jgi:hypothetical protein
VNSAYSTQLCKIVKLLRLGILETELTLKQVLKQMPSGLQADLFQGGNEVQKSPQANSITWFKPEV